MSNGADVQRVETLHELNAGLVDFGSALAQNLATIQSRLQETTEWIDQRERHWRNEVRQCGEALDQAQRAYIACRSAQDSRDHQSNGCPSEAAAVARAKSALERAGQELSAAQHWRQVFNDAVRTYLSQANRARQMANGPLAQASTLLRTKARQLGDYRAGSMPATSSVPAFGNHGAAFNKAKQEMLVRALDDPLVSREIKGWIRHELRRIDQNRLAIQANQPVEHPNRNYIRMPPGLDAGHAVAGLDTAANLRFEDAYQNRHRWHVARRLGVDDRLR